MVLKCSSNSLLWRTRLLCERLELIFLEPACRPIQQRGGNVSPRPDDDHYDDDDDDDDVHHHHYLLRSSPLLLNGN